MGELGVLCSKMASKLIIGGCTYLGKETRLENAPGRTAQAGAGQSDQHSCSQCPEPSDCPSGMALCSAFLVLESRFYTHLVHWMVISSWVMGTSPHSPVHPGWVVQETCTELHAS